ncbi:hypothetical protein, partial [Salmonella sp. s54395]|uniref:hypothetical protein n=1 Tax=Salmonella sp. s54395 TaxID=3159664 RepID=UPI00398184C0
NLPMPKMAVPDLKKLLKSPEIQGQIRPIKLDGNKKKTNKKNPLKNPLVMQKLNPYSVVQKRAAKMKQLKAAERRQALLDEKRGLTAGKAKEGTKKPAAKCA